MTCSGAQLGDGLDHPRPGTGPQPWGDDQRVQVGERLGKPGVAQHLMRERGCEVLLRVQDEQIGLSQQEEVESG